MSVLGLATVDGSRSADQQQLARPPHQGPRHIGDGARLSAAANQSRSAKSRMVARRMSMPAARTGSVSGSSSLDTPTAAPTSPRATVIPVGPQPPSRQDSSPRAGRRGSIFGERSRRTAKEVAIQQEAQEHRARLAAFLMQENADRGLGHHDASEGHADAIAALPRQVSQNAQQTTSVMSSAATPPSSPADGYAVDEEAHTPGTKQPQADAQLPIAEANISTGLEPTGMNGMGQRSLADLATVHEPQAECAIARPSNRAVDTKKARFRRMSMPTASSQRKQAPESLCKQREDGLLDVKFVESGPFGISWAYRGDATVIKRVKSNGLAAAISQL
eukprot:SAG31_NODE_10187_length_1173_cov_1.029795_1_plen_332_part_01